MNNDKLTYIEESGLLFDKLGMTRMAGRVFGYLIVCDEDAVSFDQIRETLQASKGSISGTMKQLQQIGMAEAVSLPGDRKTYYRVSKIKIGDILKERIALFMQLADHLDKGNQLKLETDDTSEWLIEASTFYNWVGDRFEEIIKHWEAEKDNIIRDYHGNKQENSP